jgi:RNA polymerase sigma factor (sigma-70 family)
MNEPQQSGLFVTTHWSLVLAAGDKALPESEKALASLYQGYWGAVYAFVRRQASDVHEAQDLTQTFFTLLLEKNLLTVADPSRGRFRSFLLTSVRNFIHNEWDKQKALKRGGDKKHFAFDFQQQDSAHSFDPVDTSTPERLYERRWALALLELVMTQLRMEYVRSKKESLFDRLKGSLLGRHADNSLADVAGQLGISENAAKVAAHRLRKRYREL